MRGLFTILALVLILPGAALAQFLGAASSGAPFTLSVTPQYPAPYSQAVFGVLSDSIDLANATMTVLVGGKKTYQGSVQSTSVTLGKAGVVVRVDVTISSNGANYKQAFSIRPQDVSLIAEPISSAPVLYPGKPLVPLEGSVRVVAVANLKNASGKSLDPSALSYAWAVDGMQIADSSGIGKQAVIVASPLQYRSRDVSVAVTSQDGSLVGGASLSFSSEEPSVRIYENDPLLGIRFERALSNTYTITGAESTLYAAPFSLSLIQGVPLIQWFLDGAAAQTGSSITLRPAGSGQGSALLSLVASAGDYTKATVSLPLSFGAKPSSNFFGL